MLGKAGKPYARLIPLDPPVKPRRMPGRLKGRVVDCFFDPLPDDELAAWEGN